MAEPLKPATEAQALDVVRWAAAGEVPLELVSGGTKRALGRPFQVDHTLDLSGLQGVTLYEPEELVMAAAPGTRLAEIEALLAAKGQQLAFEPADLGPLLGGSPEGGTVAGAFACNLSGPRRIKAGAARDHLLGLTALSGRGETFRAGGRVVKNVTGYDLPKLMTGSFGTLGVLTSLTFKVLPAPEQTRTVLAFGLDDAAGIRALTLALQSPYEVAGAAHLPARPAARSSVDYVAQAGGAVTAVRLEGFGPSVAYRCAKLRTMMDSFGQTEELHSRNSAAFWREVRDVHALLAPGHAVWRLSVAPSEGPAVVARIGAEHYFDWGGGLIWLALDQAAAGADGGAARVRAAIAGAGAVTGTGGHATLIRAAKAVRAAVEVFQPQPEPLAALTRRVKQSFDPGRILNPGRMYAGT